MVGTEFVLVGGAVAVAVEARRIWRRHCRQMLSREGRSGWMSLGPGWSGEMDIPDVNSARRAVRALELIFNALEIYGAWGVCTMRTYL